MCSTLTSPATLLLAANLAAAAANWNQPNTFYNPTLNQDSIEYEDGEPRIGFVQLNSGSTSFNTTLNLTGPILLGLGIATATLFYAYFNAFQGRKKRSVLDETVFPAVTDDRPLPGGRDLVSVIETTELLQHLQEFLSSIGLESPPCQLRAVCEVYRKTYTEAKVDSLADIIRIVVETLREDTLTFITDDKLDQTC